MSLGHLEVVDAALKGGVWTNCQIILGTRLGIPMHCKVPRFNKERCPRLRQWLIDNQKGQRSGVSLLLECSTTPSWVNDKVLKFSRPEYFPPDNLKLPAEFVPQEHKVISFILSDPGKTNFSAASE